MQRRVRAGAWGVAVTSLLAVTVASPATAQQEPVPPDFTATTLEPVETITGSKSATSRIAQTDPELLGLTDSAPVDVVIKLDDDSVATYQGTIPGLAATSPSVTDEELTGSTPAEVAYDGYIDGQEGAFVGQLDAAVAAAAVGQSLRTVYGGVAATIPANQVDAVLAIAGVVAVQQNKLEQLLTDSSPEFIGADTLYSQLGGDSQAGAGVIFGVLDSGAGPEHPSYADQGNLGAPPAKGDGTPRECDFEDNPQTGEPFACNNKLIGAQAFLATYLSSPARAAAEPYHTARDSNGHGTHTGTTGAGNVIPSAEVLGVDRGPVQGIAPGAWVSVYKVCGIQGCFSTDSAAAVGQAIVDGVDVSTSPSPAARTRPPTLSSWPSSTHTRRVFSSLRRPATAGRPQPPPTTSRRGRPRSLRRRRRARSRRR